MAELKLRDKFKKVKIKRIKPKADKKIPLGPKRKLRRKKVYVKEKCHFHTEGVRCSRNAVGSGQLCEKHGGKKIDIANTLSPEATQLHLAQYGDIIKFNPGIHPLQMIDLSRQGLSTVEIAAEMEVSVETLKKWAENYEEMAVAFEVGKALHEAWWLSKGKSGLDQRSFNTGLYKYLTSNLLGYAEKTETKNTNMNMCGVLVAPIRQSVDEWTKAKTVRQEVIDVEPERTS